MKPVAFLFVVFLVSSAALAEPFPTGELVEDVACRNDPTQTYTLYLPAGYPADRTWPALLIFDPRGRGTLAAKLFLDGAKEFGWILMSSDNTRSDASWDPNQKALEAMWPDVHERHAVDPRRIYASGFSGGAIVSYYLGQDTGGLAGVIGVGGRWADTIPTEELSFPHYGIAGDTDFNYPEMRKVDHLFAERRVFHRLEIFSGPHGWMPTELARDALAWMEVLAMRAGLRPADPELAGRLFAQDAARAAELEAAGRVLEALRRYRAIAATFVGLRDLETVNARARALVDDPRVAQAEKEEQRWDAFAASYEANRLPALNQLRDPTQTTRTRQLVAQLNIPGLLKQAENKTYEGVVAQRILNTVYTRSGFYMARDFAQEGRFREAMVALEIAIAIREDSWRLWYDLACYAARGGQKKQALKALERAVALGFDNLDWMSRDTDLDPIRKEQAYLRLAARLSKG